MAEGPYWLFVSHVLLLYVVVDQHADDDVDDLSQQNNRVFRPGRGKGTWFGHNELPPSSIPSSLPYTKASVLTEAGCSLSPEVARPRASYFTRKKQENVSKHAQTVGCHMYAASEIRRWKPREMGHSSCNHSKLFKAFPYIATLSRTLSLAEGEQNKKTLLQQGTL